MANTELYTVRGKTTRFTKYDSLSEIEAIMEEKGYFHDGTVECISHDAECTSVAFKHYNDPEHTIQRLIFTGNVVLNLNLDLVIRSIYEIKFEGTERVTVFFDGIGIEVQADHVVLQIQELIS